MPISSVGSTNKVNSIDNQDNVSKASSTQSNGGSIAGLSIKQAASPAESSASFLNRSAQPGRADSRAISNNFGLNAALRENAGRATGLNGTSAVTIPVTNGQGRGVTFFAQGTNGLRANTSTTIPRAVAGGETTIGLFKNARPLTGQQAANFQANYTNPQQRANYATNLANLGRGLTAITQDPTAKLSNADKRAINNALSDLNTSYTNIKNGTGPVPDPVKTYQSTAKALDQLGNNPSLANNQNFLTLKNNILPIGASNYYLNRLSPVTPTPPPPVGGATPPPSNPLATLPAFKTAIQQPLVQAQLNPNATFGTQASQLLTQVGANPNRGFNVQVNSANAPQAIVANDGTRVLLAGGQFNAQTAQVAKVR